MYNSASRTATEQNQEKEPDINGERQNGAFSPSLDWRSKLNKYDNHRGPTNAAHLKKI